MQTNGRFFDDIAKMAGGAMGAIGGVREEAEAALRQRLERVLSGMNVVARDEFDAMADVARRAREEQEKLTQQVAALSERLAKLEAAQPRAAKNQPRAAKKLRAKKPASVE